MKVKNINDIQDSPICRCGSWLNHWERLSKDTISYCPVIGCNQKAIIGTHVILDDPDEWYILPTC